MTDKDMPKPTPAVPHDQTKVEGELPDNLLETIAGGSSVPATAAPPKEIRNDDGVAEGWQAP